MGTLYECLREARLEKYYPAFRANGIMHSQELAHVTMAEFAAMGISGTEDRRRLTDLVNIIKTVSRYEYLCVCVCIYMNALVCMHASMCMCVCLLVCLHACEREKE